MLESLLINLSISNKTLLIILMAVLLVVIIAVVALGIVYAVGIRKRQPVVKVVMAPKEEEPEKEPEPEPVIEEPAPAEEVVEEQPEVEEEPIVEPEPEPVVEEEPEVIVEEPAAEEVEEVAEEVEEEPAPEEEIDVVTEEEEPVLTVSEVVEEQEELEAAEVEEQPVPEEEEEVTVEEEVIAPVPVFVPELVDEEGEEEEEEEELSVAAEEEEEETAVVRSVDEQTGMAIVVRFRKSYTAKLIQSKDETKSYYTYLKNVMLSYKKVKSRISWGHENFNFGRNNIARYTMRGKSLCIYFALDPDDYADTKYKVERSLSKKYEGVPCLYRIKNARRAKYAVDLIKALMDKYGIVPGADHNENYYMPYRTTEQLVEEGLIKELVKEEIYNEFINNGNPEELDAVEEAAIAEAVAEPVVEEEPEVIEEEPIVEEEPEVIEEEPIVEEEPEVIEEEPIVEQTEEEKEAIREQSRQEVAEKQREEVSAEEVNDIIADKVAVSLVESKRENAVKPKGKKAIINIDTLSANYERDEIVSLESLKAKKLVDKNIGYVKVLARGTLAKPLTVEAHYFSIEAVKMIILTGGSVIRV